MEARHCLALVLGTCIWSPVIAATDTDSLVREMRRLSQRVEQLEAANRRLEAAQNQSATAPGSDTTERLVQRCQSNGNVKPPVACLDRST